MQIGDKHYKAIWLDNDDDSVVKIIDQTRLPFNFEIISLTSVEDVFNAIKDMTLRGAPLIGAAGAFGIYLSTLEISPLSSIRDHITNAANFLKSARPTAINLEWAINRQLDILLSQKNRDDLIKTALQTALQITADEEEKCRNIGLHGLDLISEISTGKNGEPVNILTHCNAGWLACIDYGTATAPIYLAHDNGIKVHVWVDETRPRNQGARLTAYELGEHGVPYTLITDNAGGHLMQHGMVDIVIVGSDRTSCNGDVANKTGTYLKALAARDNNIPFYVALPTSSIDINISDGIKDIPVEQRHEEELTYVEGQYQGKLIKVRICPDNCPAVNYGFDVTPAKLVSGLITEKGICPANKNSITKLFSDKTK